MNVHCIDLKNFYSNNVFVHVSVDLKYKKVYVDFVPFSPIVFYKWYTTIMLMNIAIWNTLKSFW